MPAKIAGDPKVRKQTLMQQRRAAFVARGLTTRGTKRKAKRYPDEATRAHVASMNAERERRESEAREQNRQILNLRALHESDTRVIDYRAEKAKREDRLAPLLAEAKAQLAREDALNKTNHKGGRPRKHRPPLAIHRDPANALVEALERGA